jgi:mannose/fructose/N-acetylgalactosamine-specific phosphotransferase system component IID
MHHFVWASVAPIAVAIVAAAAAVTGSFVGPVTTLITEVASHKLLSRNAESCDLDSAPTF